MMSKPVLICAADLTHLPDVQAILKTIFDLRLTPATTEALTLALPQAEAYYASLNVRLTDELLSLAPRMAAIVTPSTGLDHIDLAGTAKRGIAVLGLKDERDMLNSVTATAELAWSLVLACARRLPAAFDTARAGCWARDALRGHQLAGKTFGIVGCGRLGTMVSQYARAFRMNVLAYDVQEVHLDGVESVGMDELLVRSDVVSLHIHLTDSNRNFFDRQRIFRMKPDSILVNTSRGAIVDEAAVLDAVKGGHLMAYGTDVIDGEWRQDLDRHPLIRHAREHDNVVITPHIGGVTYESQAMAMGHAAQMLVAHFRKLGPVTDNATDPTPDRPLPLGKNG